MKHRVLFVCKERINSYGNSVGLVNSATFLSNMLIKNKIDAKVVTVIDSNYIDREVYNFKPTHVVVHALFVPTYKLEQLICKYKNVKWQIRIHSKIPFLSNEGIAIEWLRQYDELITKNKNLTITTNSVEAYEALNYILKNKVAYLPNVYYPSYKPQKQNVDAYVLNVGCFGAIRPLKNQLIQAMAAIAYADKLNVKLRFHINATRVEQRGESVYKNIKNLFAKTHHELVEAPWMTHEDFLKYISKMDIGMQVSFTETFNIVTADFVYSGIPIVVSKDIDWMPWYSKCDTQNINSIIHGLIMNSFIFDVMVKWNKIKLSMYNFRSKHLWMSYFKNK